MKNLDPEEVAQLLQVIQKKPAQRIVHFCENASILNESLASLCKEYTNDYYIYCTDPTYFTEATETFATQAQVHTMNFNLRRPRYLMQAIEYDYLISTLDFTDKSKTEFLEKCYPIIRTGGNILLFISKTGYEERDEWWDVLEEQYYVSVNIIDNIFEHYDVISAKRMHGWGN